MKAADNVAVPQARRSPDMAYNPFARGRNPVGVLTVELDASAGRPIVVELWYPATEASRGRDLDDVTRDTFTIFPGGPTAAQHAVRDAIPTRGVFPLVLYFHGGYGHRRECTHLCTHLASHGYVVAAANFPGDSIADLMPSADGSEASIAKNADRRVRSQAAEPGVVPDRASQRDGPAGRAAGRRRTDWHGRHFDGRLHVACGELRQSQADGVIRNVSDVRRKEPGAPGPPSSETPTR